MAKFKVDGAQVFESKKLISSIQEVLSVFPTKSVTSSELPAIEEQLIHLFKKKKETYFGLLKALAATPAVQALAVHPDVLSAVKECGIKSPTFVTQPLIHIVSPHLMDNPGKVLTPFHQDVTSTLGSVGQVVVWIPLHEVKVDNFPVSGVLGSHKKGILETVETDFGLGISDVQNFQNIETIFDLKLGQFLCFSSYFLHRTVSTGQFRIAVSFRFNDVLDADWQKRDYYNPFQRTYDKSQYEVNRKSLSKNSNYFD